MADITKNGISPKSEYTVSYRLTGGVDFSCGGAVSRERLAYAENMYRDYEGSGGSVIESVPGFRSVASCAAKIHSIFCQRVSGGGKYLVIHAGDRLFRVPLGDDPLVGAGRVIGRIADAQSAAFSSGYGLYILDGTDVTMVAEDGTLTSLGADGAAYIPTTYCNGVRYEQRNFLTDAFKEKTLVASADDISFGSDGIYYRITDAESKTCAVTGTNEAFTAESVTIPSYATIDGERYRVTSIDDNALEANELMLTLKICEGVTYVGKKAFADCIRLSTVMLPDSLSEIDDGAFLRCSALTTVYAGSGLMRIGSGAFELCTSLTTVYYASNVSDFASIDNHTAIGDAQLVAHGGIKEITVKLPVYTEAASVERVYIGDDPYAFENCYTGTRVSAVTVTLEDKRILSGKTVTVLGTAMSGASGDGIRPTERSGASAILGCTVCELFDGRVFLSGNPTYPSTVFYSAPDESGRNNPTYFGVYNHFTDGVGSAPVSSLLAVSDAICVFKSADDGDGSIFYHTPLDTDDDFAPRVYPVSYIHTGIGALGPSISFYDDPVFLTEGGLYAISKRTVNLERSVVCRSHNVNARLLTERLSAARLAKWCGYLAVAVGGHIYLADSRATFRHSSGAYEYEWYYLDNIGVWRGGTQTVYNYASVADEGFSPHPTPDEPTYATVMSVTEGGATHYFTEEDGKRYALYCSGEVRGGGFYPATALCSVDDRYLFFGTEHGDICVFNNDKRGVPPPYIAEAADFDAEEYALTYGGRIHPYYYTFDGRSVSYAAVSALDDCGIPHLVKSSVGGSLTLRGTLSGRGSLTCEVGTDRSSYREAAKIPNGVMDFSYLDFSSLAFTATERFTLPVAEKEKGWVEKQISVRSVGYCTPIGIESATYRFTVKGRIKKS